MSNVFPSYFSLIAEHSICQPGNPTPQGDGQRIICSEFAFFQIAIPFFPNTVGTPIKYPIIPNSPSQNAALGIILFLSLRYDSAISNAERKGLDIDKLSIYKITVADGPIIRRFITRELGKINRIRTR